MAIDRTSRRRFLQTASTLGVAATLPSPVLAQSHAQCHAQPVLTVLAISDMHSAYERAAQLLARFEHKISTDNWPHVIAINGDHFEHGNAVSVRSDGVIDWAFLAALPKLAPTIFNLGNHDNDLINDLAEVVARLKALGIHVVTTIKDSRTGMSYADPVIELPIGERRLRIVGMGTDALNTYPKQGRELLDIPAAQVWAGENLATALAGSDLRLVLAHAGVAQEREILPLLPAKTLMIGGHNHLRFTEENANHAYVHTGSWANHYTEANLLPDGSVRLFMGQIDLDAPRNPALAALIASTMDQHLTEDDRAILGHSPTARSLGDTGRQVAQGLAKAAGADIGFIGHTTLGTGIPAGPVSKYDFDAVVRFDGKLMVAEVTPEQYAKIAPRLNQDRPARLSERTGDFLYASGEPRSGKPVITLATNDWAAINQAEYFGLTGIDFREIPSPGIKAIGRTALLS